MSAEEIPEEVLTKVLTRRPKRKKIRKYVNTWKPSHTNVVYLHLQGDDDDVIMEKTGYSRVAVWNILRTPEAEKIKNAVHAKVISRGLQSVPEKIAAIQAISLENISKFISDTDNAKKNPFSFFDRNVKALEVVGNLQKKGIFGEDPPHNSQNQLPSGQTNIQNNFILAPEHAKPLLAGLSKAQEVAEAHPEMGLQSIGNLASLKRD